MKHHFEMFSGSDIFSSSHTYLTFSVNIKILNHGTQISLLLLEPTAKFFLNFKIGLTFLFIRFSYPSESLRRTVPDSPHKVHALGKKMKHKQGSFSNGKNFTRTWIGIKGISPEVDVWKTSMISSLIYFCAETP